MMQAIYQYSLAPRGDTQTLVYWVWDGLVHRFAWITVNRNWLQTEASINDLKSLAIAEVNP